MTSAACTLILAPRYFMSLVMDVTLGLVLTYYLLLLSNNVLSKAFTSRMKSGNYFKGVKKGSKVVYVIDHGAWLKQILIWLSLVFLVCESLTIGETLCRGCPSGAEWAHWRDRRFVDEDVSAI